MSGLVGQLLPSLIFLVSAACFAVLWRKGAKGRWFPPLVAANTLILGLIFAVLAVFDLPTWRAQVLGQRLTELPVIFVSSSMCLAHAGRLAARSGKRAQFGEVAKRPRLRRILVAGPAALIGAWFVGLVAQMIWPAPMLDPFAPAPTSAFVITSIIALPGFFYVALLGWLFAKAAGPSAPASRLRLKNLSFSVGTFAFLLLNINGVSQTAVAAFFADGTREAVTAAQLIAQDLLMTASASAFVFGLAIRLVPAADEAILKRAYPALLKLQDSFESHRWHLVTGGKVRRLVRATHHASGAAELLKLTGNELERALTTIELTAILADPSVDAGEITPENARALLALQDRVMRDEDLTSKMRWPDPSTGGSEHQTLASAPLRDALEAALHLAAHRPKATAEPEITNLEWYGLAEVAAIDARIIRARSVGRSGQRSLAHRRALHAYRDAKRSAVAPIMQDEGSATAL